MGHESFSVTFGLTSVFTVFIPPDIKVFNDIRLNCITNLSYYQGR